MKALLKFLLPVILLLAGSPELLAQRQKKESNKVTPASAQKKEAGALESQDKATRKRMKKTLKKAERHSWGNRAPWYKRWFRRK